MSTMDHHKRALPDLVACPDRRCAVPAEITDRFDLASTDGPIPHVATRCARLHAFTVPLSAVAPDLDRVARAVDAPRRLRP